MHIERMLSGHYHTAEKNPSNLPEKVAKAEKTILDIGIGTNHGGNIPRCNWNLSEPGILYIGCDPSINKIIGGVQFHTLGKINRQSEAVIYTKGVETLPKIKPDYFSAVAPNPEEISNGEIFNYGLEKFLSNTKIQLISVVLDTNTQEFLTHGHRARKTIEEWMRYNYFKRSGGDNFISENFKPNSSDLGALSYPMHFTRNPGR
jgi:hypothetical protein